MIRTKRTRRGFTLVEVLVAAALCIWGMWLLTWLYQQGLESFRQAHAQSELMTQLRMSNAVLQRDMEAQHFLSEDTKTPQTGSPFHGTKLSDQRMDLVFTSGYTPPRSGFFRAGSFPASVIEATDNDGFSSTRSTNHFLHFTVILPGGSDSQMFSAMVPYNSMSQLSQFSGQYFTTSAEVIYYLKQSGVTPGGVQLFDLYRQQRLVARTTDDAPAYNAVISSATPADIREVMVANPPAPQNPTQMATLSDLTIPYTYPNSVRLSEPPAQPLQLRYGEDKLMSNVLSFEVKFTGILRDSSGQISTSWPTPFMNGVNVVNSDYPYDNLPFDNTFDTYSQLVTNPSYTTPAAIATAPNTSAPIKPIRITGAQIRIRAYDQRTHATRQTTLTVKL